MSRITNFIAINLGDGYDLDLTLTRNGNVKIIAIKENRSTLFKGEMSLSKEKAIELRNAIDSGLEKGLFKAEDSPIV